MRRLLVVSLLLLTAASAFGHAGEVHKYMGTISAVHSDGSFVIQKKDGASQNVAVSASTKYVFADGGAATKAEVAVGKRVVVTIAKDGRTADEVKLPNPAR
jgi:hypothetical protein